MEAAKLDATLPDVKVEYCGVPIETNIVDAIVDHCDASAAHLCVLASVELTKPFGEAGARRFTLGSVAQALARRAQCHALVLKNFSAI